MAEHVVTNKVTKNHARGVVASTSAGLVRVQTNKRFSTLANVFLQFVEIIGGSQLILCPLSICEKRKVTFIYSFFNGQASRKVAVFYDNNKKQQQRNS